MASVKHYIQRIKEGRLKELMAELLWMYAYVRRYWLLIGVYVLLGASGSILSLGTSVVSKDLVDAIILGRNGKTIRRRYPREEMERLNALLDSLPHTDEEL